MNLYTRMRRHAIARGVCFVAIGAALLFAQLGHAADAAAPASAVTAGSMVQFAFGLAIVLGLIVAAGWVMKRYSLGPTGSGLMKVIAGVSVGQRERVVVVEIGDTWMVLGVAPGRVSALHTMPRGEIGAGAMSTAATTGTGTPPGFAAWLKDTMEKRRRG